MARTNRKTLPHSTGTDNRVDVADKRFGAQLAAVWVDDPGDYARKAVVTATLRDDPLRDMCLHGRLNAAQFEAGRKIQAYFELAEIGDLQAVDPTQPVVDCGVRFDIDPMTAPFLSATKRLAEAQAVLGQRSYKLVAEQPNPKKLEWAGRMRARPVTRSAIRPAISIRLKGDIPPCPSSSIRKSWLRLALRIARPACIDSKRPASFRSAVKSARAASRGLSPILPRISPRKLRALKRRHH